MSGLLDEETDTATLVDKSGKSAMTRDEKIDHYKQKSFWMRVAWNVVIIVGSIVLVCILANNERHGHGLSTRMHTEHIHKGGMAYPGFVVGWSQPRITQMRTIKLVTSDKTGVKSTFRSDHMCNLNIQACNKTGTVPSTCLCAAAPAGTGRSNCESGAKGMDASVHAGDGRRVPMHFERESDFDHCYVAYMIDATITTNESPDLLCTHAPQLLGMVLGVLLLCWAVQDLILTYKYYLVSRPVMRHPDSQHDNADNYKRAVQMERACETILLVFVLVFWGVAYLIITFGTAESVQQYNDLSAEKHPWRYKAMIADLTGQTYAFAEKSDNAIHYTRSEAWGSWVYGLVVFVIWGFTNMASYTFDYSDFMLYRRSRSAKVAPGVEMSRDGGARPMEPKPDWSDTYGGEPLESKWNLSSFGLNAAPNAPRPSYSLLIKEESSYTPKDIVWEESISARKEGVYKNMILVTVVLLNMSMFNRYVMDVNMWNVFFFAVSYGVLDFVVRRANELLRIASRLMPMHDDPYYYVWFVGSLLKGLLFAWGVICLTWEFNMSPRFSTVLSKAEVDDEHVLKESNYWFDENQTFLVATCLLWGFFYFADVFTDYQYAQTVKVSDMGTKYDTPKKRTMSVHFFLYIVVSVYIAFFVIPTLFSSPAASAWKHFSSDKDVDRFSAYEWERNNWIYGVARG